MKTKILELINKKNKKGEKIFDFFPLIIPTTPWRYSNNEDMRYYLWLCQLQKWLIDTHQHYIYIIPCPDKDSDIMKWTNNIAIRHTIVFRSAKFEKALEQGVYEILTILIREFENK